MTFYREKTKDYFLLDTSVENVFIHEFMPAAPEKYVKVYLLALMHADLGASLSRHDIARHLGMEEEDVLKAWNYWEKAGVIRKHSHGTDDPFDYDVSFVNLRQQMYGEAEEPEAEPKVQIHTMLTNPEIKEMIVGIERTTGRGYSSSEIREILSWINEYQLRPEAIAKAFAYCGQRKKTDVRYVEAVVRDWSERGIRDEDAAEDYLRMAGERSKDVRRIFQALGFRRNATEKELEIIASWFDELGASMETILAACEKTSGISNPSINYVNRVLINWTKEDPQGRRSADAPPAKDLDRYYELIREKEERAAEERRREVYEKVPRIREIEEELSEIGPELSRIIISGRQDGARATEALKQKQEDLQMEKAFLLTDNGYETDYMDIWYACPHCKDTGRLESGEICQCAEKMTREEVDRLLIREMK